MKTEPPAERSQGQSGSVDEGLMQFPLPLGLNPEKVRIRAYISPGISHSFFHGNFSGLAVESTFESIIFCIKAQLKSQLRKQVACGQYDGFWRIRGGVKRIHNLFLVKLHLQPRLTGIPFCTPANEAPDQPAWVAAFVHF